ncbi:MAG: right-handed parallel beta-helix repeat-containing protein [Candidatus Hydrogenedentes bacterium]|nr:right-handed parallel beta-helix repeat-containing protein [Candidatus Hydrogenedentota bacterium]
MQSEGMRLAAAAAVLCSGAAMAAEYYVATDGDDTNSGSEEAPFATIQHAADAMGPGDTCIVRAGTYRESVRVSTSGEEGRPIRFAAAPGARVVLDGTEPIAGPWTPHDAAIFRTSVDHDFAQLFCNGAMLIEARWPNMRFPEQLWDRSTWARAGEGSRYGSMVDPALAETGVDWTGARATLNVAHQFYTWTRTVTRHTAGAHTFEYTPNLAGITHYADKTTPWEDDRYFLSGTLGALDSPGEWFLDTASRTLYVQPPAGVDLDECRMAAKVRNYAFDVRDCSYVTLSGFDFFATTFAFEACTHCLVEDCRLRFPTCARRFDDPDSAEPWADRTLVDGDHNTVRRCTLAYGPASGLVMLGEHNLAEDNLIHDMAWYGSLRHAPLGLFRNVEAAAPGGGTIRHNTVYNFGNAGICYRNQPYIIEYNHVYNGGLCCEDVALVYTGQPTCAGSVVRYNWVHGCRTYRGWGLGIRGDDQTRRLTVHHNVVWDCGRDGIIVKGDFNRVYNNTVFDIGCPDKPGNYISLHTSREPVKPWRKQYPLLETQNANSEVFNNAALTLSADPKGTPLPPSDHISHNYQGADLGLVDPAGMDFRPRDGSPLIDAGREIPGYTDGLKGAAPDIGAYEAGGEAWRAGITWAPAAP